MKEYEISWLKIPLVVSIIRKAQKELNENMDKIRPFPGIKEMLLSLKSKCQIGILSSNSLENINKFLKANELEIFDFVYSESNLFGKDKALKKLIKKYNLSKKDIYYVGDEVRDIESCHKIGVKILCVSWGLNTKKILMENKPDFFVEEPRELVRILVGEEGVEPS